MSACSCAAARTFLSASVSSKSIILYSFFCRDLDADRAFHYRNAARVAIPHLDRVIAQVSMAAEHLDAFISDPHRLLAVVGVRELRLPGRVAALLENRGRLPRHPSHRVGFDPHI